VIASTPAAADTLLAPAQFKAALWADPRRAVHAVAMGDRIPDLAARLAAANVVDHECLRPGALTPEQQRVAAYMVPLERDAAITHWLLCEAAAGLGDWGVVVLSTAPRLALRSHLRSLTRARLPDGRPIDFDWMDPAVLEGVLPLCDPAALEAFMGPMQSIVVPRAGGIATAELELGRLQWRRARLAATDG
jgi:hypothetical protein